MSQEIVKKVTAKSLGLDKDSIIEVLLKQAEGYTIEVAAFVGIINAAPTEKETDLGTSLCFEGDIIGVNQLTGLTLRGPSMYLPGVAETLLAAEIRKAIKKDDEGNILSQGSVEFKFSLTAKKDKSSAVGYVWGLKVHGKDNMEDPVKKMLLDMPLSKVAAEKLAIAAPAPAAETKTTAKK